ncbi:DUF6036 family nucleotidyltransferase [Arthrobacter sp.]|uniref:DUF6036 family nucleotidyltransferase n=1 Tax=Arthrobacter sp. TaxID=1667 RepID=UPI003A91ED5B
MLKVNHVIVVGSQAILATYAEDDLPAGASRSLELDVMLDTTDHMLAEAAADELTGTLGEYSPFNVENEIHVDGVDYTTCVLPAGWRDRLIRRPTPAFPGDYEGWFLEKHDLGAAKLCAGREKNTEVVWSLLTINKLSGITLTERLRTCDPWSQPDEDNANHVHANIQRALQSLKGEL